MLSGRTTGSGGWHGCFPRAACTQRVMGGGRTDCSRTERLYCKENVPSEESDAFQIIQRKIGKVGLAKAF